MFKGLAPWLNRLPGRLLHTNVIGCAIFAAVSGSSAATCATIGKMTIPELKKRGYPEDQVVGTLAGAGTLGLLIPPSIIMIVYGVSANVSITRLFIAGIIPGILLALLFMRYIAIWALRHPDLIWFGIFIVLVVEMAQITPPVGFNLFVLQGMTGRELPWLARKALPMFFLMIPALALLYVFPGLATWLPQNMRAGRSASHLGA